MLKTNPWYYSKHDYITPEDIAAAIAAAIAAGGTKLEVWEIVLKAIEINACEDVSCCAFVAYNHFNKK